ncbi:UDP-phosphate galactose phosphotransferase [Clostridia bacterium]|nr:UDP-phosphate galactose phosphotransferase [Clostridia bacterium]
MRKAKRYDYIKRGGDIALSALALLVLSPFALLLRVFMHPMLFTQRRAARGGGTFTLYKLRSMRADAPPNVPTHLMSNAGAYITPFGAFIRKTSIDELPQLWNVLRGDMSLVGPRPALWNQDDLLALRERSGANLVRPGLTGLAQIMGRDELPVEVKADYDGQYARDYCLKLDIQIIFSTVGKVFTRSGVRDNR